MTNDNILRSLISGAVLALVTVLAVGCNTTEGFGEDVEEAGEGIEDAAD
ncbi:MAG: entericidin A/B family lipoprotein [Opitutales bacterium]